MAATSGFLIRESLSLAEAGERARQGQLYAVLDACDEPIVPALAEELGESSAVCLFQGEAREEMWALAPYLFAITPRLLQWIRDDLWSRPWGVLLASSGGMEAVFHHLRRFLIVRDPAGETMYFRFYDPRVLPAYLDSCTPGEIARFFGPAEMYATGFGEEAGSLAVIRCMETDRAWMAPGPAGIEEPPPYTLRPEQMAAAHEARLDGFRGRSVGYLQEHYPDETAGQLPGDLRFLVQSGERRALTLGLEAEDDVLRFIELSLVLGADFVESPRYPWAREILSDPQLDPHSKSLQLYYRAMKAVS